MFILYKSHILIHDLTSPRKITQIISTLELYTKINLPSKTEGDFHRYDFKEDILDENFQSIQTYLDKFNITA